jgi:hypothetical protein
MSLSYFNKQEFVLRTINILSIQATVNNVDVLGVSKLAFKYATGDAYSSMAPDPTSDTFGGPCTPIL